MKFAYKNLLGSVYKKGNLIFTPNGNSVISPVGNRVVVYDLKNNKTNALPIESKYNFTTLELSPNGHMLVAFNEVGECSLISLLSQTIIHKHQFKRKIRAAKFSSDGKHLAVCKDHNVFIYSVPGTYTGQYNAFTMERFFHRAFDDTTCLSWSSDSNILAVGSKDMTVKFYTLGKWENFRDYSLGSHNDYIVACFFESDSFDLISISRNGRMCLWECTLEPSDLKPNEEPESKKKKENTSDSEDDIDQSKAIETAEEHLVEALEKAAITESSETQPKKGKNQNAEVFRYSKTARHYLCNEVRKEHRDAVLTSAAYHKGTKILITGFSTGAFFIHELPEVNLIHSLSISDQSITSIAFNQSGDWIALGCGGMGQLLVWEWQSETYVMKQQGHSNNISCVAYSADGQIIATGGEDGKVKLWNVQSGFCFVTFAEHTSAVTAVTCSGNKKFVASASMDGTVRAFDVIRYRNFRTFTSPRPVQFSSVAVDSNGEFVAAGGKDVFEIFLWSMKLGRLLDVLSGHEGPIAGLSFNPLLTSTTLASVSWDKKLKIWDAIQKGAAHETIDLVADGLSCAFSPNGEDVAVTTLNGHITIFHVKTATEKKSIEGRNDLGSGRMETDLVTAKQTLKAKAFSSICYSADGKCLLAGGQSKNVCIYDVNEGLLVKKFEITQNRSFDAVDDFINRRKMTEFGNKALIEEREELEGGNVTIKLPGVRSGDMSARSIKPEIRVFSVQFSPTGEAFAVATTEGLLLYSLNVGLVFDPWGLEESITPVAVRKSVTSGDFKNALMMSLRLNEATVIQEVLERIPMADVELIVSQLPITYVEKLLKTLSVLLDNSVHLEFYMNWIQCIFTQHGLQLQPQSNMTTLLAVQKGLTNKYECLSKICDFNKYSLEFVLKLGESLAAGESGMELDGMSDDDTNENFMLK